MAKNKTENEEGKEVQEKTKKGKPKLKIITADLMVKKPKEVLSISPAFDFGVGGITWGDLVILGGIQKGGKSLMATHIVAKVLQANPEARALYYDIEHRLKGNQQLQHPLLDLNRVDVLRSSEDYILLAEEGLEYVEEFAKTNKRCVIVLDSTSALCSNSEYAEEIKGNYRSTTTKMLSMFYRRIMPIIAAREHIIIPIAHIIANLSGYGGPGMDSGNNQQYASNIAIITRKKELWKDSDDKVIGQKTYWKSMWSSNNHGEVEFTTYNRYNAGIDCVAEQSELGLELGLIDQSGAWYEMSYLNDYLDHEGVQELIEKINKPLEKVFKVQGFNNVLDFLNTHQVASDLLNDALSKLKS